MTLPVQAAKDIPKAWWKSAVVYQIYPASFYDSNGDGVGDLKGVISKLDYLKSLGVDVLWMSPIFKSPQCDMGYDISDYRDIHEPYGSVADVQALIAELDKRGMKLILDLVVNHTSDEHAWFTESRSSKTNPKRDWYFWRPARYDGNGSRREPNNWQSVFGGSAWQWDETTEEYYLHYFDKGQPDLNWETPEVREEVYDIMKYWLDMGVAGFRQDVIARISKDIAFPDAPIQVPGAPYQDFPRTEGPRLHEFLREMNREVLSKGDFMTVGEISFMTPETMLRFVHPDRHEIGSAFCFDHVNVGLKGMGLGRHILNEWKLPEFKAAISRWQTMRDRGAWHAIYLENHDQPRSISRFASDAPEWRWASGRVLALMHATLFGTLYIHQGEELGMINLPLTWPLAEFKDVQTQNIVREINESGGFNGMGPDEAIRRVLVKARDHGRSPVQWSAAPHAGFSTAEPWMRVNDDYGICNAESQIKDMTSLYNFWKEVLGFRKANEDILIYGSYRELTPDDERIFAYVREAEMLVILNMTNTAADYSLPESFPDAKVTLATTNLAQWPQTLGQSVTVPPYSGAVYRFSHTQ